MLKLNNQLFRAFLDSTLELFVKVKTVKAQNTHQSLVQLCIQLQYPRPVKIFCYACLKKKQKGPKRGTSDEQSMQGIFH